ncbi:hypothetical protein HanRHA438_Chr15g0727721 [Helianthus annuus]|nr:hypothetical protein HanRHA438_Chr15g0727721 [Helianthus annuus]
MKLKERTLLRAFQRQTMVQLCIIFSSRMTPSFGDWSLENAYSLARLLRCFNMLSGLNINLHKSSLVGMGMSLEECHNAAQISHCKVEKFPFSYLGLKVGAQMSRVNSWRPVLDMFDSRLAGWKVNSLSTGGRLTILKSVLECLPTYFFSLYKVPEKIIRMLEAKRRKFLWVKTGEKKKTSYLAWERVTTPKKNGGLGPCPLETSNLALLSKWWWRYKCEDNAFWKQLISAIHFTPRTWPACL